METRAHYVLVGFFTLAVGAGVLLFAWWMAGPERGSEPVLYDVVFNGEVHGIQVGSDVLFHGISVGKVKSIAFDPENPRTVRVRITVERRTPMRVDVIAEVVPEGFTGMSAISLSLGPGDAPALEPGPGEIPVLEGAPPVLVALRQDIPQLLANANELLERIADVFDQKNRVEIDGILVDVHTLTSSLAGAGDRSTSVLTRLDSAAQRLDSILANADTTFQEDLPGLVEDIRGAVEGIDTLATSLNSLIEHNRQPIDGFVAQGLGQVPLMLAELRQLIRDLESIANQLEHDPSGFLLGGATHREYESP